MVARDLMPPVSDGQYLALAGYVLAALTGWWPGKVARDLGDPEVQQLFLQTLADGMARRRITRDCVNAGLQRIEAEGAEWPPLEVPKLLRYFSPVPDYYAAFVEAQGHAVALLYGEPVPPGKWSHPAVYWAAERFDWWELRNASWPGAAKRWAQKLEEVLAWGEWPAIVQLALPDERRMQTREVQQRELAKMRAMLAGKGF